MFQSFTIIYFLKPFSLESTIQWMFVLWKDLLFLLDRKHSSRFSILFVFLYRNTNSLRTKKNTNVFPKYYGSLILYYQVCRQVKLILPLPSQGQPKLVVAPYWPCFVLHVFFCNIFGNLYHFLILLLLFPQNIIVLIFLYIKVSMLSV